MHHQQQKMTPEHFVQYIMLHLTELLSEKAPNFQLISVEAIVYSLARPSKF